MVLTRKATRLLKWLRHLQVREISLDELAALAHISKAQCRLAIHELEVNGDITLWMED